MNNFNVMVDVEQCPGCCDGPYGLTTTSNDRGGLDTPGLMKTVCNSYSLELDGCPTRLGECSSQGTALGDYGDYSGGSFKRTGNLFEDMRALGIDPTDSAYCSVVSRVSGFERKKYFNSDHYDLAVASPTTGNTYLVLHQPKGISLPANEHLVLLLKALSSRLASKHLVITTVQCSDFYRVDDEAGVRTNAGGKSAAECVGNSTETEILTPLCIIASPQVWRRQPACVQRRKQFRNIR
ncbi:hypothetical protein EDC04DRAFT_2234920 [Pisolithus marmoratus]|nr:hypothetical protein EDC04DRAFT_2234920 [Pisolithus marmoratus]